MKIAICGSMSASKEMVNSETELINMGHEVVLPAFVHDYVNKDESEVTSFESIKEKQDHDLLRAYFAKLKQVDALLVVNPEKRGMQNYIGGNSFLEMGFTYVLEKPIYILNDIPEISYKDEIISMNTIVLKGDLNKIK